MVLPAHFMLPTQKAKIPRWTAELAYFLGFLLGDGCIGATQPVITMTCHSIDEDIYARSVLIPLIELLFGVKPNLYKCKHQNAYHQSFHSKEVADFLTRVIGFPIGGVHKHVPLLIACSTRPMKFAFIQGFFDADGCLVFSRKTYAKYAYPSIELKSVDREVLAEIAAILEPVGFRTSIGRSVESSVLRVNGCEMLNRWMKMIGSKNMKHITKYQVWQKFGYCPPSTDVPQRLRILAEPSPSPERLISIG